MSSNAVFQADRATYVRAHIRLTIIAMVGAMAVLWLMGDPNIWVGAVAGLAAIGLRGWYLMSEEFAIRWELGDTALSGPGTLTIPLSDITLTRTLAHYVQVVTNAGHKHLIKYQADPGATKAAIDAAVADAANKGSDA